MRRDLKQFQLNTEKSAPGYDMESGSKVQPEGEKPGRNFFFSVKPVTRSIRTNPFLYEKPFPYYKRPVEVGFISSDQYSNHTYDRSMLKMFAPPLNWKNCKINLNEGYEEIMAESSDSEDSDSEDSDSQDSDSESNASVPDLEDSCPKSIYPQKYILRWIMKSKNVFFPTDVSGNERTITRGVPLFTRLNTDFVCERLTLRHLLQLPYPSRFDSGCSLCVIRFRGTYYLYLDKSIARFVLFLDKCQCAIMAMAKASEKSTPISQNTEETEKHEEMAPEKSTPVDLAPIAQKPEEIEKQEKMSFWGVNFERLVTTRQGEKATNTEDISPLFENFYSISCSILDSHKLCMICETDCEDPKLWGENKYIELKTARLFDHRGQYRNFCRYKLINWWIQCFLNGVSKVVCGFRDDNGIVHELKAYFVEDLPHMAQNALRDPWRPEVCFNFLSAFLDFVKSIITEDDNKCYYVFASEPGKEVKCFKVVQDLDLLPDWYVKWDAWDKPCTM